MRFSTLLYSYPTSLLFFSIGCQICRYRKHTTLVYYLLLKSWQDTPCIVMVVNVGLDSGRSRVGLSEGAVTCDIFQRRLVLLLPPLLQLALFVILSSVSSCFHSLSTKATPPFLFLIRIMFCIHLNSIKSKRKAEAFWLQVKLNWNRTEG